MAPKYYNFDRGGHNTGIDASTALASPDKWDFVGPGGGGNTTIAAYCHGVMLALHQQGTNYEGWNLDNLTDHYGSVCFYLGSSGGPNSYSPFVQASYAGTACASVGLDENRKIVIKDTGGTNSTTSSTILTYGSGIENAFRVDFHFIHSATTGQIVVRIFQNQDATEPTETLSSPASWNTGTAADKIAFGNVGGDWTWPATPAIDDCKAAYTDWPGPVVNTSDFELGTNGDQIKSNGMGLVVASNDPDLLGSARVWDGVVADGPPPIFDTTHAHSGSKSCKISPQTGADRPSIFWQAPGLEYYVRFYLYLEDYSTSGNTSVFAAGVQQGVGLGVYESGNGGKVIVSDWSGDHISTNAHPLDEWVRHELHIIHSYTTGSIEWRMFHGDSLTPIETYSSAHNRDTRNTGESVIWRQIGGNTPYWVDDCAVNWVNWIGPIIVPQTARPSADSVDGSWTDSGGGSNLYAQIDDIDLSDTNYIKSPTTPSNAGCRVKLASLSDPNSSSDHVISWRAGKDTTGGDTINMTVKLYQGGGNSQGAGTLIGSFSRNAVEDLTTYDEVLSSGEADSITDYTDLYLEFFANKV